MNVAQFGLLLNIIGVLVLGFEAWIKMRIIGEDSIHIGHGQVGSFWRGLFLLGWPLILAGFVVQFIAAA